MVSSVVTSETRSGASVTKQAWQSQQKIEKAAASPLPVRYAGIANPSPALAKPGLGVLLREWRGGVLRRDIGDAERCKRIFRKRPQGARSEARAGPLRRRGGNIRSTASRTHRAMEDTTPTKELKS